MDKEKLEKYIELKRKVIDDLQKVQQYILDEENGEEDSLGENTINNSYDLAEWEQNNLNPNPLLFDIANYIQGVIDNFDVECRQQYQNILLNIIYLCKNTIYIIII